MITIGGWVGTQGEEVAPSLQLQKNNVEVFMLYSLKTKLFDENSSLKKYNPYSGPQAFYKYKISTNKVATMFRSYDDISGRLVSEHDISGISNTKTVNSRSVSSGIYFASIHSDFGVITKRFVIE